MSLPLYFDHHMPEAVSLGLRRRGIDVITAEEDQTMQRPDDQLLARATELGRVLVTNDRGFTTMASAWQESGRSFAGVAYVRSQYSPYGKIVEDLQLIAEGYTAAEMHGRIEYLPM